MFCFSSTMKPTVHGDVFIMLNCALFVLVTRQIIIVCLLTKKTVWLSITIVCSSLL